SKGAGGRGQGAENEVTITDYRNNSVILRAVLNRPKILVLSDAYYPGWKVFVDGEERKILKANYVFRAVPLEPGAHDVEFIYDPMSFKVGMYISFITVIILAGLWIRKRYSS
ncbi:MAG: YfhO family protein, partial [Thermodesulfobacteriota bacterium]